MLLNVTNHVTLIGRLYDAPEISTVGIDGHPGSARFTLHTRGLDGRGFNRHHVVCPSALVDHCQHLAKGDRIAVAGHLRSRLWGDDRIEICVAEVYATSLEFLDVESLGGGMVDSVYCPPDEHDDL